MKWWLFAATLLGGTLSLGVLLPSAEALPFPASDSLALQDGSSAPKPAQTSNSATPTANTKTEKQVPAKKTSTPKATTAKKPATSSSQHHPVASHKRPPSPRVRRLRQAFVASASLRPMAQQLLQDRTPTAYAGVEAYARAHSKEDAGSLAWLVLGYAHVLDRDYPKAIPALSRAKLRAGDLGDYVDYYLAVSYFQTGHTAEALVALSDFSKNHPDSLLVRDSRLSYAQALVAEGQAGEAVTLLEHNRTPIRSDIEFALGRAYAASGQNAKAAEIFANIYYTMPTANEADPAHGELQKLRDTPAPTFNQIKTRADALMNRHRYSEAADGYRTLLNEVIRDPSNHERPEILLDLADALHRAGRNHEVKPVLASVTGEGGDIDAHRIYLLGQVAFATNDNAEFYRTVEELRQTAPTSPWLELALLSAANLHLVHHEYDQALDAYREAQQRFPNGARASYMHWKAAWLTFRQGRNDEAAKAFEEQISLYPNGGETPAALYWRARLAEEENQPHMARAFYQKLSERYRNFYYAELARQRMQHLPADSPDAVTHYAVLDHIPALDASVKITETEPPADELHVQKAQLLGNGGLIDFAVRELRAAADSEGASWVPAETAQLYEETGHYDQAIELMKRSAPNYFAVDIPDLPRKYWEALFPKPFWGDLKRSSEENSLDPYLVASLIRQESEFNPNAVSRANAVGLMQLLPKTGKLVAKEVKLKRYSANQLYTPAVNLQLGTRYFRGMVDKFGGSFEYALAAYNAGSDRVEEWLGQGKYRDPQEFVESIPFTETREYVQAILRNANVYKQLYGTP